MPRSMTVAIALALAAGVATGPARTSPAVLPHALRAAVAGYDDAQVKGDGPALRRLLADDYLLVNSAGVVESKDDFIKDLTSPGTKLDPFTVVSPIIRLWQHGAVMGGVARLTTRGKEGTSSACIRFADIWSLRSGRWQVAYTQAAHVRDLDCK